MTNILPAQQHYDAVLSGALTDEQKGHLQAYHQHFMAIVDMLTDANELKNEQRRDVLDIVNNTDPAWKKINAIREYLS